MGSIDQANICETVDGGHDGACSAAKLATELLTYLAALH
jgi:hypothetical protein